MNSKCQKCKGRCCVGDIEVFPTDQIYTDNKLTRVVHNRNRYDKVMKLSKSGRCKSLVNGECTIYNKRPDICKLFKIDSKCCKLFREGLKTVHKCAYCTLY